MNDLRSEGQAAMLSATDPPADAQRRGSTPTDPPLLIGVSARIYYPSRPVLDLGGVWNKTLHYLEQSVAHLLLQSGVLAVMIPAMDEQSVQHGGTWRSGDYAAALDGLLLQGGNDVAPQSYGQQPLRADWSGDAVRDTYEMSLIRAFIAAGKPVFGICRGLHILNVAFGGTLWQDITTQVPGALRHLDDKLYEHNEHTIEITPGSHMAQLYPGKTQVTVNSIHHQAIRDLAPGFVAEAHCSQDGIIEAIRANDPARYIAAVQWHPEFTSAAMQGHMQGLPMVMDFLRAVRERRHTHAAQPGAAA